MFLCNRRIFKTQEAAAAEAARVFQKTGVIVGLVKLPTLERGPNIEIGAPRNGRPGYRWVQGWIVRWGPSHTTAPMRLNEARDLLRAEWRLLGAKE